MISMLESQLKFLPITDLLILANRALDLYIIASIDPKNRKLAGQREADLIKLHKIITEKRANEKC